MASQGSTTPPSRSQGAPMPSTRIPRNPDEPDGSTRDWGNPKYLEPGDSITGKVVGARMGNAGYGDYPVLILETNNGDACLHAMASVLRTELHQNNVQYGDVLTVKYVGRKRTRRSDNTAIFDVRVIVDEPRAIDWAALEGGGDVAG